ncbi:hypothetical protein HDV05_005446 [Chytridiales sp. JEL 0842]|nr:hypothetical protein HDV05_005446 [Chytridiales sp. JEL 0842]
MSRSDADFSPLIHLPGLSQANPIPPIPQWLNMQDEVLDPIPDDDGTLPDLKSPTHLISRRDRLAPVSFGQREPLSSGADVSLKGLEDDEDSEQKLGALIDDQRKWMDLSLDQFKIDFAKEIKLDGIKGPGEEGAER